VTGISVPSGVIKVIDKGRLNVMVAPELEAQIAPETVMVKLLIAVMVVPVSVEPI